MTHARNRNSGCRIRDLVWRGHRCITLENELLRVLVVADKGADILEFLHKPTDTECLWQSPAGLQPPGFRPSSPLPTGHFREYWAGGWYEMLPNGPGPCEHRGAAFGYHGEATLLAWDPAILTDLPEHIAAAFEVRLNRIPLHVRKVLELRSGEASLSIEETITSEAAHTIEFLWGQHPTFGPPLAEPGSRLILPRCEVVAGDVANADARITSAQRADWPLVRGRDGVMIDLSILPPREVHSHDFVRLENLEAGRYTIYNPARDLAFTLHYDARLFPVLGFWQLYCGGPDYPWYQRHYLAALEPACDLPSLSAAAARGTAFRIEPGQCVHAKFDAVLSTGEPAL